MSRIDISHITLPSNFHEITDFYLPEELPNQGIFYPGPQNVASDPNYYDIVEFMVSEAKKKGKSEFSLEMVHEGRKVILRGQTITSVEGLIYIFRRLPSYIPKIEDIGMPGNVIELLLSPRLSSGGLIIIAGETGQGKSTTAASCIASRLKNFGSFCLTIEDPIEMPLQGYYENPKDSNKKGVCFQTNCEGEEIFEAIKSSLRCYPSVSNSMLFLGETRDAMMASEVLKIATNGHLVVTTLHGSDLTNSLKRFIQLASSYKNANEADVKSIFSSVFRLLIHQKLDLLPNGKRRIRPQVLFSPSSTSTIASRLRSGQIELLSTDIQNQNTMINKGTSILNNV